MIRRSRAHSPDPLRLYITPNGVRRPIPQEYHTCARHLTALLSTGGVRSVQLSRSPCPVLQIDAYSGGAVFLLS